MSRENSVMVSLREVRGIQEHRVRDAAEEQRRLEEEATRLLALKEQHEEDARAREQALDEQRARLENERQLARQDLLHNLQHALLRLDALETRGTATHQPAPGKSPVWAIAFTACAVAAGVFFVSQQRAAIGRDLARVELTAQKNETHIGDLANTVDKVDADGQLTRSKLAALGKQKTPTVAETARPKPRGKKKRPDTKVDTRGPNCDTNDPSCGWETAH